MILGSNYKGFTGCGTKADPDRSVTAFDFGAFESLLRLVMDGGKVPDLEGSNPIMIPGIVNKIQKKDAQRQNQVEQCENCGAFRKNGKRSDTTGKGIDPSESKTVPCDKFHY